jgi:hypothetical protein
MGSIFIFARIRVFVLVRKIYYVEKGGFKKIINLPVYILFKTHIYLYKLNIINGDMDKRKGSFENRPKDGEFKAPSSPKELKRDVWFCLKHIKEYNKKGNYFSEMSADEIEEIMENDIMGHRKTKKKGTKDVNYFEKKSKIPEQRFPGKNKPENLQKHPKL